MMNARPFFLKIMITIGNIVLWERLTGRGFYSFNVGDAADMSTLLYVMDSPDCELGTYESALGATKGSELQRKIKAVAKDISKFLQYASKITDADEPSEKSLVGDIVGQIIFAGQPAKDIFALDIDYLPYLSEQYAEKVKRSAEHDRNILFTLLSPYLSQGTTPHSFMPLDWDESEISEEDISIAEFLFGTKNKAN